MYLRFLFVVLTAPQFLRAQLQDVDFQRYRSMKNIMNPYGIRQQNYRSSIPVSFNKPLSNVFESPIQVRNEQRWIPSEEIYLNNRKLRVRKPESYNNHQSILFLPDWKNNPDTQFGILNNPAKGIFGQQVGLYSPIFGQGPSNLPVYNSYTPMIRQRPNKFPLYNSYSPIFGQRSYSLLPGRSYALNSASLPPTGFNLPISEQSDANRIRNVNPYEFNRRSLVMNKPGAQFRISYNPNEKNMDGNGLLGQKQEHKLPSLLLDEYEDDGTVEDFKNINVQSLGELQQKDVDNETRTYKNLKLDKNNKSKNDKSTKNKKRQKKKKNKKNNKKKNRKKSSTKHQRPIETQNIITLEHFNTSDFNNSNSSSDVKNKDNNINTKVNGDDLQQMKTEEKELKELPQVDKDLIENFTTKLDASSSI